MADIHPFRGIHFNPSAVQLEEVVAPPYNRITPELYAHLYAQHPHNAVRLTLAREGESYAYAASCQEALMRESVLLRDNEPALYVLSQSFKDQYGGMRLRAGVIALCRLEEFRSGRVQPHLKTLPRPREDRFRQIQAMNTNVAPVMALYSDPSKEIERVLVDAMIAHPMIEMTAERIITRMWRVTSNDTMAGLQQLFKDKSVVIADGHHMYEAALTYRDLMKLKRQEYSEQEASNHVMTFLTSMDGAGAVIAPVYRMVKVPRGLHWDNFVLEISKHFRVKTLETPEQIHLTFAKRVAHTFCILHGSTILVAVLNDESLLPDLFGPDVPPELRTFDSTIVHSYMIERLLGLDEHTQQLPEFVRRTPDIAEALRAVTTGESDIAFLTGPARIEHIVQAARAGHQLPPRATMFIPPLYSGLIMNKLDEPVR